MMKKNKKIMRTSSNCCIEDVRIAVQAISHWENPGLLLELEAIILRATEPPYNVQIPSEQ